MYLILRLILFSMLFILSGCTNIQQSSPPAQEQPRPSPVGQAPIPSRATMLPTTSTAARPTNFAFIFRSRACGFIDLNVLDSANGTLVHTPLGETTAMTLPLQLTTGELDVIYQKVLDIDFFSYPSDLRIPEGQVRGMVTPAPTYQLQVTEDSTTHAVRWTDDVTEPKRADIDRFRELIKLIEHTMQAHPAMHQLPTPRTGCA